MSAFADQPLHFLDWLQCQSPQLLDGVWPTEAASYRAGCMALSAALLNHGAGLAGDAARRRRGDPGWCAATCLGPHDRSRCRRARHRQRPTGRARCRGLAGIAASGAPTHGRRLHLTHSIRSAPVLLVGSGLTMVDAVITLLDQGHGGPIHVVSRRGLLPRGHTHMTRLSPFQPPLPADLRELTRMMREHVPRRASLVRRDRRPAAVHAGDLAGAVARGSTALPAPSAALVGRASASYAAVDRRADRRGSRKRAIAIQRSRCGMIRSSARHGCAVAFAAAM